jgi:hypothetical protein
MCDLVVVDPKGAGDSVVITLRVMNFLSRKACESFDLSDFEYGISVKQTTDRRF